jgi:hypothetical protein
MIASMPLSTARALLKIAADASDCRARLKGFWLEPSGVAMASDGHALLAIRGIHVDFKGPPVFIARLELESFLKACGKSPYDLVIERGALRCGPQSIAYHAPEASDRPGATEPTMPYFDWRRVIPQQLSGIARYEGKEGAVSYGVLDSRILERLRLALGELRGKTGKNAPPVFPMPNGAASAVLETGPDVLALLMPMRTGKEYSPAAISEHAKSWAAQPATAAEPVETAAA